MTNEQELKKIDEVLEEMRPNIQMDGNDVSWELLVSSENMGKVYLLSHCNILHFS